MLCVYCVCIMMSVKDLILILIMKTVLYHSILVENALRMDTLYCTRILVNTDPLARPRKQCIMVWALLNIFVYSANSYSM